MFKLNPGVYNQNYSGQLASGLETGARLGDLYQKSKEREKQQRLKDLYKASTVKNEDGSFQVDRKSLLSGLYKEDPQQAEAMKMDFAKQDAESAKNKFNMAMKQAEGLGQILGGVKDQATWESATQQAKALGIPGVERYEGMPYDPSLVKQLQMQSLSVKDQLANQFKTDEFGLKQDQFGLKKDQFEFSKDESNRRFGLDERKHRDNMSLSRQELDMKKEESLAKQKKLEKGKELTPNMIKKVNEGNAIPSMLTDIADTIEANKGDFGPIEGRIRSNNPYDTRAQTIDSQMRAASQAFGRYMEGGVLRKEDEEKYRRMFPKLSDTPEVAKNKLAVVERLLQQRQNSDIEAFKSQGFNLEGLDKGFKIKDVPDVIAGDRGQKQYSDDELNQMSEEDLDKIIEAGGGF